ncbi:MAG: 2-C-methyl-D-erythritol 4-phosphate cytidylyltransferase, partial [Ruminococcaceae bacterium]|nr:2-C-methyl-D-erythritol 4-phosphate cytidylyltransferase [Oscillospiraceae bacterium]
AAATGVPCKNTLKMADDDGLITDTPDRSHLFEIQTPQGFSKELITKAHSYALENHIAGTDDCYLVEQLGHRVKIVDGDYKNIKITTPEDLLLAELFSRA